MKKFLKICDIEEETFFGSLIWNFFFVLFCVFFLSHTHFD